MSGISEAKIKSGEWMYLAARDDWASLRGTERRLMLDVFRTVFDGPGASSFTDKRLLLAAGQIISSGLIEIRFRWRDGKLDIESRMPSPVNVHAGGATLQ